MESSALQKSKEMAIMSNCRKEPAEDEEKKSRKSNEVDLFVFLPDDIVVDILKRLPEAFLSYRAKYVCRRWMDVITSNRILPDCASLILQNPFNFKVGHVGIREEEGEEGLQVKVHVYRDHIPPIGKIRSWGNEFLLMKSDDKEEKRLYVYNLITKEGSYLPKCNASGCGEYCTFRCGVAISFDRFNGLYKVVHLFSGPPIECHILTLRSIDINYVSSKWKSIQFPDCMNGGWLLSYHNPVSVQGRYIHWRVLHDNKRLISMDMVKQEIVDRSLSSLPLTVSHTTFF